MIKITTKLSTLKACNLLAETKGARYYLHGVNVSYDKGVTKFQATNGHYLIRMSQASEEEAFESFIIPGSLISLIKTDKKADDYVIIEKTDNDIVLKYNGAVYSNKVLDGSFPDTERLFFTKPEEATIKTITINPSYIGLFAKVNKELGIPESGIKMTFGLDNQAAFYVETSKYTAIVMPMSDKGVM